MSAASAPITSLPTPQPPWQPPAVPCNYHAPAPTLDEDTFRKIEDQQEDVSQFAGFLASSEIDDKHTTLWAFWWKSSANTAMAKENCYFSHDVRKNHLGNPRLNNHFGWCCKTCHQGYYEDLCEAPEKQAKPDFQREIYSKFGGFFRMPEVMQVQRQTRASAREVSAQELQRPALPEPMQAPAGMAAIQMPEVQPPLETTREA